ELRVLRGGCEGTRPAYEAVIARGEKAKAADELAPGRYGFSAVARRGDEVIAEGCADVMLPTQAAIEIVLRSEHCVGGAPTDAGEFDANSGLAPDPDASPSGSGDAATHDPDAGPAADAGQCPENCDDDNPCTVDQCISGTCYWTKLSATLECDS